MSNEKGSIIFADVLITGGCGFIGSHFVDRLIQTGTKQIVVVDNLSSGVTTEHIQNYIDSDILEFYQIDIRNKVLLEKEILPIVKKFDLMIHLAAQPSVPISVENPRLDFDINMIGSFNILELARNADIHNFVFAASGGTIYGEASFIPTPETYKKMPISNYGAAKGAFEMYLSSYSHLYGLKCTSLRFGNVFGERSTHGVIHDFYKKLLRNPKTLKILGDGNQMKSYLYIKDCINGFITSATRKSDGFEAYNMAATPPMSVIKIADVMSRILKISPEYQYTGGKGGWKGDVTKGELDCSKLMKLGWQQSYDFNDALGRYLDWLKHHYQS